MRVRSAAGSATDLNQPLFPAVSALILFSHTVGYLLSASQFQYAQQHLSSFPVHFIGQWYRHFWSLAVYFWYLFIPESVGFAHSRGAGCDLGVRGG